MLIAQNHVMHTGGGSLERKAAIQKAQMKRVAYLSHFTVLSSLQSLTLAMKLTGGGSLERKAAIQKAQMKRVAEDMERLAKKAKTAEPVLYR